MESTLFIGYARENASLAQNLKRDLEEEGLRCWIDTSDFAVSERARAPVRDLSFSKLLSAPVV